MLDEVKRELEKYEGTWRLPEDLDALMELIKIAMGGEWVRGTSWVEYEIEEKNDV